MTILATEAPNELAVSQEAPRPLRPVRVAVAGLGRKGIAHAAVLSTIPDCELVGVADPRAVSRRNLRGVGFCAPGYPGIERLLETMKPEAVFISLPPGERMRAARLALEAGAAVLIDRPFAPTAEEAEKLVRLAAERQLPLACAHPIAFQPVFSHVHSIVSSGVLGAPRQVRSSMYLSRVFGSAQQRVHAAGGPGGVVAQFSSDLLFLLVWYLGTPAAVRAQWSRLYGELEDELHAMFTGAGGVEIGFDSSWSVPGYPQPATVIELDGENGKLLASDDAVELDLVVAAGDHPAGHSRTGHSALPHPARFDLAGEALYLQDAAFLAWVTGGAPPPNDAARSLAVVRLVEALYASAREGGRTVPVPA